MSRLSPWLLLFTVVLARAAAPPVAPDVDRGDAAQVADTYLTALSEGDIDTVLALLKPDEPLAALLRMMRGAMAADAPGGNMGAWLTEMLFLPTPGGALAEFERGEAAEDDGTVTFAVRPAIQRELKLVLVRDEAGEYQIDLRASLEATVGPGRSMMLQQADMMGNMNVVEQGELAQAQAMPWEAQSKVQRLVEALLAYAEEHEGKLPEADRWTDELADYVEGDKPFGSPNFPDETYSFAFNGDLSGTILPTDWQQRQELLLLACTGGDEPNLVFFPDDLAELPPRYGTANLVCSANQTCLMLEEGQTFADVLLDLARYDATQQRLSALHEAVMKYAAENDGRLPDAATWCDDLAPLLPERAADGGDPLVSPGVEVPPGHVTFAMNTALAGAALGELRNRRKIVLFVETEPVPRNTAVAADHRGPPRHRTLWSFVGARGYLKCFLNGGVTLEQQGGEPPEALPAG